MVKDKTIDLHVQVGNYTSQSGDRQKKPIVNFALYIKHHKFFLCDEGLLQ